VAGLRRLEGLDSRIAEIADVALWLEMINFDGT
jgi:hypothetical protein